ncbi:MAG: DUF1844 domain-containing protein [Candidatus Sumerlaeia bacterium]|nr:DUF1844 domain-containing protein [Candidatus Sumerlaeia bacterium]
MEEKHNQKKQESPKESPGSSEQSSKLKFPEVLPPAEFAHIVETFAVQALIHLGRIPNPVSNQPEINLNMAKFNIDLLENLRLKTKGNLTAEEEQLLEQLLHISRMTYIELSSKDKT